MGVTLLPWLIAALAGALITAGVAAIYWPAALITGGVLILAALFADLE